MEVFFTYEKLFWIDDKVFANNGRITRRPRPTLPDLILSTNSSCIFYNLIHFEQMNSIRFC